jgi:hypothetical protein
MTAFRVAVFVLTVVLVAVPFLGFAAGDQALEIWNTQPRHASGHVGVPHITWKTTPAAVTSCRLIVVVALVAHGVAATPASTPSIALHPPFVPPRV